MRRQGLPSSRTGRPTSSNNANSRASRVSLSSPSPSPLRSPPLSVRRTNTRLNANPIIMTKAQHQRRRTALLANSSNLLRSIGAAETDVGPILTSRNITPSTPSRVQPKQRNPSAETNDSTTTGDDDPPSGGSGVQDRIIHVPIRIVRAATRRHTIIGRDHGGFDNAERGPQTLSSHSIGKYGRNRVTFDLGDIFDGKDSVSKVLTSEKILPRILGLMSWNELLPLRGVCKAWFDIVESQSKINRQLGVIVIRSSVESKMTIYNASSVTWAKFRFIGPVIFDMTKPVQNEFWNKHGPRMTLLDIHNRSMSLTALVEILARCPKLEYFKCNWTPEMYSFNSELIKKYYGIHFNNGTFANLQQLTIDSSYSLTDSALWSILKWCGGSIKSLKLTSSPDEDILHLLKPRWSMESIKNYFDRFGYTGNLQYLDFSWSNLANNDLRSLSSISMNLKGITLNYCKVDDDVLRKLLQRHGDFLEVFKIEGTSFSDPIFNKKILPKVKVLHIGGLKGTVKSLGFLSDMPYLEDLSCKNTQWLEQSMILRPFNSTSKQKLMRAIDFSGGVKYAGNKNLDPNLNKTWFSDFTGLLANLRELNLSNWSSFGTNQNFKNICQTLTLLEKLVVKEWGQLSDVGTTGLYEEEIHEDWGAKVRLMPRVCIGLLKCVKHLDLSGTSITDATLFLALHSLQNLRSLALDNTRVTDNGLKGIIDKIKSLDRISVSKCSRISLAQPRYKRPDGRIVFFGKI